MKRLLPVFLLFIFIFAGCTTTGTVNPAITGTPAVGVESSVSVGDIFFNKEPQIKPFATNQQGKFDLTVVELNDKKIGLQYAEYLYTMNFNTFQSAYLVKQGFNKRFDYDLSNKVIRFKGYEFEVLSVKDGMLTYKRLK